MSDFITLEPIDESLKMEFHRSRINEIVLRHGHIAITNYKMGDNVNFEHSLSKWDKMRYRYILMGGYYVKKLREFRINRGYDLGRLKWFFPNHTFRIDNDAFPSDTVDVKLMVPPKDDFQRVAITFMACQGEYKKNSYYTQQLIEATCGSGKTFCAVASSAVWSGGCIVFIPIGKLLVQWRDAFTTFTSIKKNEIMIVKGSDKCEKIRNGECSGIKIFLMSTDTFNSYHDRYGDLKTIEMLRATRAHVKIVDEVHRDMGICSKIEALSNFHINYYMSASPGRADRFEDKIFEISFTNTPKFGYDFQHESEKHINIIIKKYVFDPTNNQVRQMYNPRIGLNGKSYEKVLTTAIPEQRRSFDDSLRIMFQWSKPILDKGNKILVLTNTIAGTEYVKMIADAFFPGEVSTYYSSKSKEERKKALEKTVIVATEGSLGTRADNKGIQHVYNIITYSNKIGATQYPGRGRKIDDDTPIVYVEFVNMEYRKTYNQYLARKPYLVRVARGGKLRVVN